MRTLLRSIFSVLLFIGCFIAFTQKIHAAALTVCASGCTGPTIEGVLNGASVGDTVTVQGLTANPSNPYNPATEAFPINFRAASTTLICANSDVVIGQQTPTGGNDFSLTTSSTISGCTFSNINLGTAYLTGAMGQSPHGIYLLNNTFSASATSTASFGSAGITDFVISGNTNFENIAFTANATNTRGLITNNTFRNRQKAQGNGSVMLNGTVSTTNISIINNTFTNTLANVGQWNTFVNIDGENITFASNTIRNVGAAAYTDFGIFSALRFSATGTNYIGGNDIEVPTSTAITCVGIDISPAQAAGRNWTMNTTLTHNTIRFGRSSACDNASSSGIMFGPNDVFDNLSLTLNATYNLIDKEFGTASGVGGIELGIWNATTTVNVTSDYNGAYGFTHATRKKISIAITDLSGVHDVTTYPFLKLDDSSTSNDSELAPFSPYLDVNGTEDIGSYSAVRSSSIDINGAAAIDYSSNDATSTYRLTDMLRSGDTVNFASGNYTGFSLSSANATSSLTFAGAGPSLTSLVADTNADALRLTSVTSTVISGLSFTSASSTSYAFTTTKVLATHAALDYNEASSDIGSGLNQMAFFNGDVCQGTPTAISADGTSVTALDGTSDIHLVLFTDTMGARVTGLVPDNYLSAGASVVERFNADCSGFLTAVTTATSTFTGVSGTYTYNASPVTAAGITFMGGIATPAITTVSTGYAGLRLASSSVVASNVAFDDNGYGIWIGAGSGSSTLMNATSTRSSLYDLRHDVASTSTLMDVSFVTASTTFTGAGGFDVYYSGRVLATNTSASPLTNIYASTTPATVGSETSLGTTDGSGYTAFRSLLAHRMNSSSVSLTNAGKNPYTWTTGASGGYIASSTTESLSTPYQTVTLAMSQRNMGFMQGSGAGLESVTATSIRLELSSVSGGASTVDYTVSGGSATGSGTDYTLAAGTATIGAGETETTIDLTVVDDSIYEGNETIIIQLSNPSGVVLGTNEYIYTITDNDTAGVTLSEATASVTEGSTTDSYTVVLDSRPTSTVEVLLSVSNAQATISTSTIAFTTANWFTPVTVTVTATDDSSVEGSHSATITHAASSTNLGYGTGLSITSVAVTITDNDTTSSGGGGGGGGGATGYIPSPLPAPVSATTTVIVIPPTINVTFLDEPTANPEPAAPQPIVPLPASEASVKTLLQDAKSFGVSVSAADQARLASFIEFGTSPASKALGSGERRAVIRDVFETLGKAASTDAIEKLVNGQLSGDRNLEREKAQLVRARGTFNTIYGRDPNFKDADENLAWNTLMYRIRFPRDLSKEKTGIVGFQKTFRKTPSDPFQWAVVRVLGYVR